MSFTISLNSQLADFPPSKIFWAIVAKNQNGVFCHMDADGNLIPMTKADNTNAVGTAKNCDGSNTFANYFSTLEALPTFTIPDDAFINSGQIWVSLGNETTRVTTMAAI